MACGAPGMGIQGAAGLTRLRCHGLPFLLLLSWSDGVRRVGFCPTQHRLPSIEGVLAIGPSGALLRATWVFHTPRPVEEAGGEVTLAPVVENGTPALMLPVAGLYWRRLGQRSYYQAWEKYAHWVVSPTDSIPRLPPRAR
jgi:hypothetical protein